MMGKNKDTVPARPGALAEHVADKLRRLALSRYSPGERLPSEQELAARLRRSRFTIRKALALLEAQGIVRRNHGSGTYVSEHLPLHTGTTGLVYFGGATSLLRFGFARDFYEGLLGTMQQTHRHLHLVASVREDVSLATEITERFDLGRLDSIICLDIFSPQVLGALAERLPTVSADFACTQPRVSSCRLDHEQSIDLAVNHLWLMGHRRIALVGEVAPGRVDPAVSARRQGFAKALAARGIPPRDDQMQAVTNAEETVEMLRRWLERPPASRPTALICVHAYWQIAQAAVELGVDVPGQLSLVSLSVPEAWLELWNPSLPAPRPDRYDVHRVLTGDERTDPLAPQYAPLRNMVFTSVALPLRRMGQWAMAEVQRRVGRPDLPPEHDVFSAVLVPGNTVAPPAE